jgi:hypothetical protein
MTQIFRMAKVLASLGAPDFRFQNFRLHLEFGICNLECWKSAAAYPRSRSESQITNFKLQTFSPRSEPRNLRF